MDERGYVAQALLDRLRDDGVAFCVLSDARGYPESAAGDMQLAVPGGVLAGMPRRIARFAQEFDLHLVQLLRIEQQRWHFVLAWSDEIGRPSFLTLGVVADYYRAARRLLRAEDLLSGAPDALFLFGLAEGVEQQELDEARGAWLGALWQADPRGAIERIGRFWRRRGDIRLLARAAKGGDWSRVRPELPRLRRALRNAVRPGALAMLDKLFIFLKSVVHPAGATVAFVGERGPSLLRERVARDLAPAFHGGAPAFAGGLSTVEHDYGKARLGTDVGVLFDPPDGYRGRFEEVIEVEGRQALPATVAEVERALLRWLECRVERRHPDAVVGENPLAARLLQFACRYNVPGLSDFMRTLLNCGIYCRLRSPILMPHPYGIVVHRNVLIGSRVTIMQQVTVGNKHPSDPGVPVIEDNVCIGAGAKILGPVRVGRGATVGANAVVTRDVPSHCTVVGVNRILGRESEKVGRQRQPDHAAVVNM